MLLNLRLLLLQELVFRLASEERREMFAANSEHSFTTLVAPGLRSQVHVPLHFQHLPNGAVVGHVQQRRDLTRRVELVGLQLYRLLTSTVFVAPPTRRPQCVIDFVTYFVEVGLRSLHECSHQSVLLFVLSFREDRE